VERGALNGYRWQVLGSMGPCVRGGGTFSTVWTPDGILLFSSWSNDPTPLAETWVMGRDGWRRVDTVQPPPRRGSRLAFDSSRQRVVMYGGFDADGLLTDTWEWDGRSWTEVR
jgi:hypothetical protein